MRTPTYLALFLLLLSAGCTPKHYTATATIQLQQPTPNSLTSRASTRNQSPEQWLAGEISILESATIILSVAQRLEDSPHITHFINPYPKEKTDNHTAIILGKHRSINADQARNTVSIHYAHQDPEVAAVVANYFAEEYLEYNRKINIDASMIEVEDLRLRAEIQQNRVETLELKLAELREASTAAQEYDTLLRELKIQQEFFMALTSRMTQEKTCSGTLLPKYPRIIEPATAPNE